MYNIQHFNILQTPKICITVIYWYDITPGLSLTQKQCCTDVIPCDFLINVKKYIIKIDKK